jgi:MFS family permease
VDGASAQHEAGRRRRFLPGSATPDAAVLIETRALRAFGDGLVSTVLSAYLLSLGYTARDVGTVITATLVGSAALTLFVGLRGHQLGRRRLLIAVAVLMMATGAVFATVTSLWALVVMGFLGTINPSAGDVSVFLPTEQALLPVTATDHDRTALFARYTLAGFTVAAAGALAANVVQGRVVFVVYGVLGAAVLARYLRLSPAVEPPSGSPSVPLGPSRRTVYRLAAVFSIDAFGGGFVVQSLIALWLFRRFHLSVGVAGTIFFWSGLLSGFSGLVAARIARRIGLIRTMVYTHLPANALLMATAFMPNAPLAVLCLLARSALSQMDVPARSSYVMAVVTPAERPAAASVTNVPRSLASALPPLLAGWMLDHSRFGWPLLAGGALKATYDLVLLGMFRHVRPPEEHGMAGALRR